MPFNAKTTHPTLRRWLWQPYFNTVGWFMGPLFAFRNSTKAGWLKQLSCNRLCCTIILQYLFLDWAKLILFSFLFACDIQFAASFKWHTIDLFRVCYFIIIKPWNKTVNWSLSLSAKSWWQEWKIPHRVGFYISFTFGLLIRVDWHFLSHQFWE